MSDDQVPDFDIRKSLSMVFATPLVVHDWPNSESLNNDLKELVLGKEADDAKNGITRSNGGGWQSAGNLITWKEPCIETFRQRSWVKHMVHPYVGEGERISIAFNVNVVEDNR